MRITTLALLLAVLTSLPPAARATGCPSPPGSSLIATFADTATLGSCSGPLLGGTKKSTVSWNICVWLTGSGQIEYSVDESTIHFNDTCGVVDGLSTAAIFNRIGKESVVQGFSLGYTPCPESGSGTTAVTFVACVHRTGSGSSTSFSACGEVLARKSYSFHCLDSLTVTATGCESSGSCSGDCESVCGEEGYLH
jgi:hypothetical protein